MIIPRATDVTRDETWLAAIGHASVIVPFWGVMVPLMMWVIQRQKSDFVRFHALQALTYQLFQMAVFTVCFCGGQVAFMGMMVLLASAASAEAAYAPLLMSMGMPLVFLGILAGGFGLYASVGIAGAMLTLKRRDFRYPIFGRRVERYIAAPTEIEAQKLA